MKVETRAHVPAIGVSATSVECVAEPFQCVAMTGRQLVQVHVGLCHPDIEANDVLDVDFDRRTPHEGMYLLSMDSHTEHRWFGARRFQQTPTGLKVQETGAGSAWVQVTPAMLARMSIVGLVREIYKPARA